MSFKFTPNPNFTDELRRDPQFRSFLMSKAEQAAQIGRTHASSGFMGPASDLKAEQTADGVAVVHESSGWHLEEYGSPTTAPRAPLRKGVEGTGLKYRPT